MHLFRFQNAYARFTTNDASSFLRTISIESTSIETTELLAVVFVTLTNIEIIVVRDEKKRYEIIHEHRINIVNGDDSKSNIFFDNSWAWKEWIIDLSSDDDPIVHVSLSNVFSSNGSLSMND